MNSLFHSVSWLNYRFQDEVTHLFSDQTTNSLRNARILSVVACVFALLGLLVCGIYCWQRQKVVIESTDDEQDVVQSVVQEKFPKVAPPLLPSSERSNKEEQAIEMEQTFPPNMGKEVTLTFPHHEDEKKEEIVDASTEDSQQVPEVPLPPVVALIPPVPDVDIPAIFKALAAKTPYVFCLPHTYNCQFNDIHCPIETRVDVPGANPNAVYLHANHVHLEGLQLILTQYPQFFQQELFWPACEKACLIVDLTNPNDMQKGLHSYAPKLDKKQVLGGMVITCTKEQVLDGINAHLYTYKIDRGGEVAPFDRQRIHYEGWMDHQGTLEDDIDTLLALFERYQIDPTQPIIIHCRAGVGRSGTLAVVYAISLLIKQGKVNASNLMEHIQRLILEGRQQRGPGFVQTKEQLQTIWNWSWRALHRAQQVSCKG